MAKTSFLILALCFFAACDSLPVETASLPTNAPARAARATVTPSHAPAISALKDAELVSADGKVIELHGFSWFGLNTGTAPDGLWQGSDALAGDLANIIWRQKLLGFNAVRLPFSFSQFKQPVRDFATGCADVSHDDVAKSVLDPDVTNAKLADAPALSASFNRTPGRCNDYLPATSARDRLIFITKSYIDAGFYVLLDNHLREDQTAIHDPDGWVAGWGELVRDVMAYEPARGRVLVDILNEPDEFGITWDKLGPFYLRASDAIWNASKDVVFGYEGTGQAAIGCGWGDGFCADPAKVKASGLSDPTDFFTALAAKPYADRAMLLPHVYGPAVTHASANFKGPDLYARLDASFGFQMVAGLPAGGKTFHFPVAIGEFGSKFQDAGDKEWLASFSNYLLSTADAKDDRRKAVRNWFYWDWNPNSGDTGGLVGDDWKTVEWEKIRYLEKLGLKPWYRGGSSNAAPALPDAKPMTPAAVAPAPPAAPPSVPTGGPASPQRPSDPEQAVPAPIAPPAPASTEPGAAKSSDGALCEVLATVDSKWQESSDKTYATVNLFIRAASEQATKVPFALTVANAHYVELRQSWNVEALALKDGAASGSVRADWATLVANPRNTVNIGFIVGGDSPELIPSSVSINGARCVLKTAKT